MSDQTSSLFIRWLQREVVPALGCTEPVAISFTTAYAAKKLAVLFLPTCIKTPRASRFPARQ